MLILSHVYGDCTRKYTAVTKLNKDLENRILNFENICQARMLQNHAEHLSLEISNRDNDYINLNIQMYDSLLQIKKRNHN